MEGRAKRLALERLKEEKRIWKSFSPSQKLREAWIDQLGYFEACDKRSQLYRRAWRWAARWHLALRLHTEANLGSVKADWRLGVLYCELQEFSIARKHLVRVLTQKKNNSILKKAEFYRRLATCDLEIFRSDSNEHSEKWLEEALESYQHCFERSGPLGLHNVNDVPTLFFELAQVYESYGAFHGAIHFLVMILDFFQHSSVFDKAALRCAIVFKHLATLPSALHNPHHRSHLLNTSIHLFEGVLKKDNYAKNKLILYAYARSLQLKAGFFDDCIQDQIEAKRQCLEKVFACYRLLHSQLFGQVKEVDTSSNDNLMTDAGLRHWLCRRDTWRAFVDITKNHEPTLAIDACETALRATKEGSNKDSNDVALLLEARISYAKIFDQRNTKICAERAFAHDEYDLRARAAIQIHSASAKARIKREEAALETIRATWRRRVWRQDDRLRMNIVARAEMTLARDHWRSRLARRDLAYFATAKWRPLFLFEERCTLRLQRFLRSRFRRHRLRKLAISRHLRSLGTALSCYKREPRSLKTRFTLVQLSDWKITPCTHAARGLADQIRKEDMAIVIIQRTARVWIERPKFERILRNSSRTSSEDCQNSATLVRAPRVVIQSERKPSAVAIDDAMNLVSDMLQRHSQKQSNGDFMTCKPQQIEYLAALTVTRAVRTIATRRSIASKLLGSRSILARSLQMVYRNWSHRRRLAATELQRHLRGRRGRLQSKEIYHIRISSRRIYYGAWQKYLWRNRGIQLRRNMQLHRADPNTEMTTLAVERLIKFASEDSFGSGRVQSISCNKQQGLWTKLGMPGTSAFSAALRRHSVAATLESMQDPSLEATLFPLVLDHWNCNIQTILLADLAFELGHDATCSLRLAKSLGGCNSLKELAIVNCALGPRTVKLLFMSLVSGGLGLEALTLDQQYYVQGNDKQAVGMVAGAAIGDSVYQRICVLRTMVLCRCRIDDLGAYAIGCGLRVSTVAELHLDENEIADQGATAIAHGIRDAYSSTLQVLSLSGNRITRTGAKAILQDAFVGLNRSRLCLRDNFIDDGIIPAIALWRNQAPSAELDIHRNAFRPEALQRLDEMLASFKCQTCRISSQPQSPTVAWNKSRRKVPPKMDFAAALLSSPQLARLQARKAASSPKSGASKSTPTPSQKHHHRTPCKRRTMVRGPLFALV